jgi:hypothetical protein
MKKQRKNKSTTHNTYKNKNIRKGNNENHKHIAAETHTQDESQQ